MMKIGNLSIFVSKRKSEMDKIEEYRYKLFDYIYEEFEGAPRDFVVCFLSKRFMKTLVFLGLISIQRFLAQ